MNYKGLWVLTAALISQVSQAEYVWEDNAQGQWPTAESACRQGEAIRRLDDKKAQQPGLTWRTTTPTLQDIDGTEAICRFNIERLFVGRWLPDSVHVYSVYRSGAADICHSGLLDTSGQCCAECPPSECNGSNPVLGATGQKVEIEIDLSWPESSLSFERNYWSSRNQASSMGVGWKHNWNVRLIEQSDIEVKIYRENGRALRFIKVNATWSPFASETEVLTQLSTGGWSLQTPGKQKEVFNALGRLTRVEPLGGLAITLTYDDAGDLIGIADAVGRTITLTYSSGLITKAQGAVDYTYQYDSQSRLISVEQVGKRKIYHYEDSVHPYLLTGISDERGVRSSTWAYDSVGRTISSAHAGADLVKFEYLSDGRVRVTNPLGKKSIYNYQTFGQRRLITSIDGEASANCPASSREVIYQPDGLVSSRTDWKGNKTTYTYDQMGREKTRTEAVGTSQQRVIATDWHPTLFLPETVTEPGRITHYQYDDQGRQLSQTIESL
ncbi:DUF6531 domain-containing protein [Pseudomonas sp. LRF_L74]|uniref:DUF6531 domain-containing protein n=1 Tax=Pseudomonas sp. LRF_L74 TaxID=3369422 RepID=UPI003F5E9A29